MFQQQTDSDELQSISWGYTTGASPQQHGPSDEIRPWSSSSTRSMTMTRLGGWGSTRATPPTTSSKGETFEASSVMDSSPGLTVGTATSERSSSTTGWASVDSTLNHPPFLPSISSSQQQTKVGDEEPNSPWELPEIESPVERRASPYTPQQTLPFQCKDHPTPFHHLSGVPRSIIDPQRIITKQYFALRWGNKENDPMVRTLREEIRKIDDEELTDWSTQFHSAWSLRSPSLW